MRREREMWAALALGVVAAVLAVVVSRGRMAGGPDAVTYLSLAESLGNGSGYQNWLESPLTTFPPAWPAVIWFLSLLGLSDQWSALVAIAASLVAIPPLTLLLLRRCTTSAPVRLMGVVAVALSPIVLPWGYLGLSEVPFTALVLGCLVAAVAAREDGRERLIWLAIALAAVAPIVRYAGLAIPAALTVWIAWCWPRRRWFTAAVAAVVGFGPLAAVAVRNLVVSDSPFGRRPPSALSPLQVGQQALVTVGRGAMWTLDSAPTAVSAVIGLAVIGVLGWVVARPGASEPEDAHPVRVLVALVGVAQIVVLGAARASAEIDDLNDRLLAPATVLVLLAGICVVGDLSVSRTRLVRVASVAALGVWCVVGLGAVARGAVKDNVEGYFGPRWEDVRTNAILDDVPADCREMTVDQVIEANGEHFPRCGLLANEPWGWFGSKFRPLMAPRRDSGHGDGPSDVERLRAAVDNGSTIYVAWTTVTDPYGYLIPLDSLGEEVEVTEVASDEWLTLYRIGPAL